VAVLLFVLSVAITSPLQAWAFGVYAVFLASALAVDRSGGAIYDWFGEVQG